MRIMRIEYKSDEWAGSTAFSIWEQVRLTVRALKAIWVQYLSITSAFSSIFITNLEEHSS